MLLNILIRGFTLLSSKTKAVYAWKLWRLSVQEFGRNELFCFILEGLGQDT